MSVDKLFISTSECIMLCDENEPATWRDLYRLIPNLRLTLCCSICKKIPTDPFAHLPKCLQFCVCGSCKGTRKKTLKPPCYPCCDDFSQYAVSDLLKKFILSYKRLCDYIFDSEIYQHLCSTPGGSRQQNNNLTLLDYINEGRGLDDVEAIAMDQVAQMIPDSKGKETQNRRTGGATGKGFPVENGVSSYSVVSMNNGSRLTIKRKAKEINGHSQRNGEQDAGVKVNKIRKRSVFTPPPTCKCGQTGVIKGCCSGYKCPCYTADSRCSSECICVACKNPRGTAPPKDPINQLGEILSETAATPVESGSWRDLRRTRTQTPGRSALN